MNLFTRQFFIIILMMLSTPGFTRPQPWVFDKITDKNGRSFGFITGIVQDRYGFIWFSTRNGLYCYDGYSYRHFCHNPKDTTSLPFDDITFMYLDRSGVFWLRHYDRIAAFENEKITTRYAPVTSRRYMFDAQICEDAGGKIWAGPSTDGLVMFDKKTNHTRIFRYAESSYPARAFEWLEQHRNQALAELINIGNNKDTSIRFILRKTTPVLIVSTGETDGENIFDQGSLLAHGKVIWRFDARHCRHAGGEPKNRIQMELSALEPGTYTLRYQSDASNAYNAWEGAKPDKTTFHGIAVLPVGPKQKKTVQQFLNEQETPTNYISTHDFRSVLCDCKGNIILLHNRGYDIFNPSKNIFSTIPIPFSHLLDGAPDADHFTGRVTTQDILWIGTSRGLIRHNLQTRKNTVYRNLSRHSDSLLASNTILSVTTDYKNNLWIGTAAGLTFLNPETGNSAIYKADNQNQLYDNRAMIIYEDRNRNLWIGTFDGLNSLKKQVFSFHPLDIERYGIFPAVFSDPYQMWYQGTGHSLYCYNRITGQISRFPLDPKLFPMDTYTGSRDYVLQDIFHDNGLLWIAAGNKIYAFAISSGSVVQKTELPPVQLKKTTAENKVLRILHCTTDDLYIAGVDAVYQYHKKTLQFTGRFPFPNPPVEIADIDDDLIKFVCSDAEKNQWIRTSQGIWIFNSTLGLLQNMYDFDESIRNTTLADGNITADQHGNIWCAALPSLICFPAHKVNPKIFRLQISGDIGSCFVATDSTQIWIYSNDGLLRYNPLTGEQYRYTYKDGLTDNSITGVFPTPADVWITTLKGLTRFNRRDNAFTGYFTPYDNISYSFRSKPERLQFQDNELMFFTPAGYLRFHPDSINTAIPPVVLTGFQLFGKEYPLDSLIYLKKKIMLRYNQNFLSFEFSALDFTDPDLNRYAYMLRGLDKEWKITDARNRKATYTSLPPGKYVFMVRASNNDNIWNNQGMNVQVIISPPWYKTVVAYILYVILTLLSFFLFIKIRERRLILEKRILEEKVRERTATIARQNEEIRAQHDKIAEQNKNITDSIHYARRIQQALLPPENIFKISFSDYFILYRPRDIVSGDFYWITRKHEKIIFAAADCTGHGVPGAMMSMLGISFLTEIVNQIENPTAAEILNQLRAQIIRMLRQSKKEGESKDGMDISLCVIDQAAHTLHFAGAYNPLVRIHNGQLQQIDADRMPIGIYEKDLPFRNQQIELIPGDMYYAFSDGYADQFNASTGEKFKHKRLKNLLLEIHSLPLNEQKSILDRKLNEWMGNPHEQIDDVLILGIKI